MRSVQITLFMLQSFFYFKLQFSRCVLEHSSAPARELEEAAEEEEEERIKANVTNDALSALVVQLLDRNGANSARSLYDMPEMLRQTTTTKTKAARKTKLTVVPKKKRKPTLYSY